jgi:hypothetical protein
MVFFARHHQLIDVSAMQTASGRNQLPAAEQCFRRKAAPGSSKPWMLRQQADHCAVAVSSFSCSRSTCNRRFQHVANVEQTPSLYCISKVSNTSTRPHLLVWVHVDVAVLALLSHIGPAVATHPFTVARWTLEVTKCTATPLVGCQTLREWLLRMLFSHGSRQRTTAGVSCLQPCEVR